MVEQPVVIIETEQERADDFRPFIVAKTADDAVGTSVSS